MRLVLRSPTSWWVGTVPKSLLAAGREMDNYFEIRFSRTLRGPLISHVLAQKGFVHNGFVKIQADISILDYNYIVP